MTSHRLAQAATNPLESATLRDRLEELRALVPEVSGWGADVAGPALVSRLIDLLERKQRHLIQENVRLAGLRELAEALLRDPEEARVARTISLYLRQAHGLPEVLVLSRSDNGGLRGYRARAGVVGLCEAVHWPAEKIRATCWQRALEGETIRRSEPASHPRGTPAPLPWILPLRLPAEETEAGGTEAAAKPQDRTVIGLLALQPDESTGTGVDALEVEQLAFQTATLLASVRHQQRALQDRKFRECLLEAMDDGLIAIDGSERITAANRSALSLLGLEAGSLLGEPLSRLQGLAPGILALCRSCLQDRTPIRHREVWILTGEARIPVSLSVVPLDEVPEEGSGAVATLSDLRPVRAMEEELRRLDRLAALGRFAAAVAHEVRNPLAAIGAGVEFLGSALDADKQPDVQRLRAEIARLNRIVTDLLVPLRAQSLATAEVEVARLVQLACQTVEPMAREKEIRFVLRPGPEEEAHPTVVQADTDRLLQVFVNLLRNAVEASSAGQAVEIGWGIERAGSTPPATIWVQDRGSGIAPEHLPHVFEPFYSTKAGGTGLGLYVSHCVVDQHGGKLTVESPPGAGTRFTMTLPRHPHA